MKTKRSRVSVITITIFAIYMIILGACQQEETKDKYDRKLPFLTISSGFILSELSKSDLQIISEAFQRLDIGSKDGLFIISQTSGSQINISEELFAYFKLLEDETNAKNVFFGPIASRRLPSPADSISTGSDCVAWTIAAILKDLGQSTYKASIIDDWIIRQKFNPEHTGVPLNAFSTVLNQFLDVNKVILPPTYVSGKSAYSTI